MDNTAIQSIKKWTRDSWDIHVHASPSLFERWGSAQDLAQACQKAHMKGFVLKFHHGSSIEIASAINDTFPSINVYGGIALNYFVGGLSPLTVEAALQLGAKIIWLPTIHAAYHGQKLGTFGGFSFQGSVLPHTPAEGISVIDDTGKVVQPMREILKLLDGQPAVLASGHISPEEITALVDYIESNELSIRLLINHVSFTAPGLSIDQLRQLQRDWVWFETVQLCVASMVNCATIEQIADGLQSLPQARWILATDSGQKANLPAPEAIASFAEQLHQQGISEVALSRMLRDEPSTLLGEG